PGADPHPERRPILDASTWTRALDLRPQIAAQARPNAMQRDQRGVADALEDRAAHALADELRAQTGHAKRLAGPELGPDGIQRASRETERFVGGAGRLGRGRPAMGYRGREGGGGVLGEARVRCQPQTKGRAAFSTAKAIWSRRPRCS